MYKPVGIIDTGSNTVLGVVFHWDERRNSYLCRTLSDGLVIHAGLIGYVEDGKLSDKGLNVLSDALRQIGMFFAEKGVPAERVSCFATASLRGVRNFPEAAERAANEGFTLELLSGEEEAKCDFAGMLQEMAWMEQDSDGARFPESGVALDMGGGSGQVLCFTSREKEELAAFQSFPIGCLALKKRFVADGLMPTDAELDAVSQFVCGQIEQIPMIAGIKPDGAEPLAFFAMGGTVKAIVRLFAYMGWETSHPDFPGADSLSADDLAKALSYFRTEDGRRVICEREPGRQETLLTGLVTLLSICRRVGADRMTVLQGGVREGYVVRHVNPREENAE